MSSDRNFDRDSLQELLASAFEVQMSGFSRASLAELMEVQRSISADEFEPEPVFEMIVRHACNVSNADGVAIALLEDNQLIYRAGSGRACSYVGRHVSAVLASDSSRDRREILRVENADSDIRIEAAICRQFDAKSLLILSVFEDRKVAGVFEVFFSQAHIFEDQEIRVYRLLAGLIEDALVRKRQPVVQRTQAIEPTPALRMGQCNFNGQAVPGDIAAQSSVPAVGVGLVGGVRSKYNEPSRVPSTTATAETRRVVVPLAFVPSWKTLAATVALAAVASSWMAFDSAQTLRSISEASRLDHASQTVPTIEYRQGQLREKPQPAVSGANRSNSAFKRVRVSPSEVDYVADDVTIRQFTTTAPRRHKSVDEGTQFDIGTDVTVRYFSRSSMASPEVRPARTRFEATSANNPVSR